MKNNFEKAILSLKIGIIVNIVNVILLVTIKNNDIYISLMIFSFLFLILSFIYVFLYYKKERNEK